MRPLTTPDPVLFHEQNLLLFAADFIDLLVGSLRYKLGIAAGTNVACLEAVEVAFGGPVAARMSPLRVFNPPRVFELAAAIMN